MTFTRNFPTSDKLRLRDNSHPVFEGTQVPDWGAFRTISQLRDVVVVHYLAWEAREAGNPTEDQLMHLEKITGYDLCVAINKLEGDEAKALALLERLKSSSYSLPGTAELCTKALTVWSRMLEAEARFAAAAAS